MSRKMGLVFSLLIGGIILLPTLWYINAFDQGVYSAESWEWIKLGKKPLIGFIGTHLIYSLAFKLFGFSMLSIRMMDYLFQLLNLALIFYLSWRISENAGAGLFAIILYSIFYVGLSSGQSAEPDGFAFSFLILSAYFYVLGLGRWEWLSAILAGINVGFAFLIKPVFGLAGLVFFIFYGLRLRRAQASLAKIFAVEILLTGSALAPALGLLLMYYWWGILKEVYLHAWVFLKDVYVPAGAKGVLGTVKYWDFTLFVMFNSGQAIWLGLLIYLSLLALNSEKVSSQGEITWLLLSLIFVSFLSMLFQARGLVYHKIPLTGFSCIFAGIAYQFLTQLIGKNNIGLKANLMKFLFIAGVIFISILSWDMRVIRFMRSYPFRPLSYVYENYSPEYKIAQYIKQNTQPEDYVLSWGNLVSINFLADRQSPSNHFGYILLLGKPGPFHPIIQKWQEEFMEEIQAHPPVYFLVHNDICGGYGFMETIPMVPGLEDFFQSHYQLEKDFGIAKLFRLKE